jgi:hypothetical protein
MKYMLKSKRWPVLRFLYNHSRKFGTTDQVLFFDNEKDIISFFNFAIEEDVANATANMDSQWRGMDKLTAVMNIASSEQVSFRNLLRHNFNFFRKIAKKDSDEYHMYWFTSNLNCNPRNYKLFTIEEKDVRGTKLKVVEPLTWYRFYKRCRANGMTDRETSFNAK